MRQVISSCFCMIMIYCLLVKIPNTKAKEKTLCPLSVDIPEIRKHYEDIKEILDSKDLVTDVCLLNTDNLNNIKAPERCCFLLELSRFYVKNIFHKVQFNSAKSAQSLHHLANFFVGVKTDLKHCHSTLRCHCGDQSHQIMKDFMKEYHKLDKEVAALKAVRELKILLHWIQKILHNGSFL